MPFYTCVGANKPGMYLGSVRTDLSNNSHEALRHKKFKGNIVWVAYPGFDDVRKYEGRVDEHRHPPNSRFNVFVGQVPNLMPLPYIAWCLDTVLGEFGIRWLLQATKNGCAKAWLRDEVAQKKLIGGNRSVLFDVCGMWVAVNEKGADDLLEYVEGLKRDDAACDPRLPRSLMVLEVMRNLNHMTPDNQPRGWYANSNSAPDFGPENSVVSSVVTAPSGSDDDVHSKKSAFAFSSRVPLDSAAYTSRLHPKTRVVVGDLNAEVAPRSRSR